MTTTMNGLRPLTDTERDAVAMHLQKVPVPTIAMRTGLTSAQIAAAVDQNRVLAQASAAKPAPPAVTFTPPATSAPTASITPTQPAATEPAAKQNIAVLLAWAKSSGNTRAMTLAARVREHLEELRNIRNRDEERTAAQAEVERLAAELEAAKARLKQAGGKTSAPSAPNASQRPHGAVPSPDRKAHLAAVRTWAREQGHEVSDLGRVPAYIQTAYDAAHGDAP